MPFFLLIVLGAVLRKTGAVPKAFFETANRFTYRIALPVNLFCNIINIDKTAMTSWSYLLYSLFLITVTFALIWLVTELVYKDKAIVGTLVQGAFRGNFVLLGVPLAAAVLGPAARQTAAMTSMIVIPLYNALSVVVLLARGQKSEKQTLRSVLKEVFTNPLIIAIFLALPFTLFGAWLPQMLGDTLNYVSLTATPLGLLSIGGMLDISGATARLRPSLYASAVKNLILPLGATALSYYIGFRGEELLVLFILFAAPVAVSSYAMASEMGGDAALASNILIITTFFSAFVLAAGIYLLKISALI